MRIIVQLESSLRDIAGQSQANMDLPEGASVQSLLNRLVEMYGERIVGGDQEYNWRHAASCVVVVRNGEIITEERYAETWLTNGDVVSLVPPIAGGSALCKVRNA